ncbi:MAG: hypothetical protein ACTSRZ_07985, partial [Promethearchaeota archaeon]
MLQKVNIIYSVIIINLIILLIFIISLGFKKHKSKISSKKIKLFPELEFKRTSKSYYIMNYVSLIIYATLMLLFTKIIGDYLVSVKLPILAITLIFILIIGLSLSILILLFKLFRPIYIKLKNNKNKQIKQIKKAKKEEEKRNQGENIALNQLNPFNEHINKDLLREKVEISFLENHPESSNSILYTINKKYALTAANVLDVNLSQTTQNIPKIFANDMEKELFKEEEQKRKKLTEQEQKTKYDPYYKFYKFLSLLPQLLIIAFWANILLTPTYKFYFNIFDLIRMITFIFTIKIDFKIDKYMKEKKYYSAVFYNAILTVFFSIYFVELISKPIFIRDFIYFLVLIGIYFCKTIICIVKIKGSDSYYTNIELLKQIDLSQYVIAYFLVPFTIKISEIFDVMDVDLIGSKFEAAVLAKLGFILFGLLVLLIIILQYIFAEIVYYKYVSKYIQKGQPSKAKFSSLFYLFSSGGSIFIFKFKFKPIIPFVSSSTVALVFSLIFAILPFLDRILDIFRKRKFSYYSKKYHAKEKTIFFTYKDIEKKIESKLPSPSLNIIENLKQKTQEDIKPDLEKLKTIQMKLARLPDDVKSVSNKLKPMTKNLKKYKSIEKHMQFGRNEMAEKRSAAKMNIQSEIMEEQIDQIKLPLKFKILTFAPFILLVALSTFLIVASMNASFFEVLYINSPFNPLSYSNEDLYLRSLQIFVLGIKYFILA